MPVISKPALLLAALVAGARLAAAHSIVTSVWVNGEDTFDGSAVGVASSYMRTPSSNSPVKDLTSASMACNDKGTISVSGSLSVAAGDTIEPEWYHSGARGSDAIATSHIGPITTWISPLDANTAGAVWVEIGSEAYYKSEGEWAVTKMIANAGRNTVTIPSTLAPGDYLIRFDILGLHEASSAGGAQFYPNCAQVTVTGSGTQTLPAGVEIPGFFTSSTPGIVWNVYYSSDYDITGGYVAPGTGVWDGTATYSTDTCTEVVDGLAPAGYCQGGSNATTTTSSAVVGASSSSAIASSAASSAATSLSIGVVTTSSIAAAVSTTSAAAVSSTTTSSSAVLATSTPVSASVSTTTSAAAASSSLATTTSSAAASTYTDYNECMRAYNKCLDAAQPTAGGAADFSGCYASFNCSSLQRMRHRRRPHQ